MQDDTKHIDDDKVVAHVRDALDTSVDRIDAETMQRINAARQAAIAKSKSSSIFSLPRVLAASATALSIFIAVIVVNFQLKQPLEAESVEAMELVATQDTLEMYEELEFYTWLVEEDVTSWICIWSVFNFYVSAKFG